MKQRVKHKIIGKITMLIIVLLILSMLTPVMIAEKKPKKIINVSIRKEKPPHIIHITAVDSYDYGYKIGKIMGSFIKKLYLISYLLNNENEREITEYSTKQITYLKNYFPHELEELQGLSDSLNIKIEKLIYLKKIWNSFNFNQCTVTLSSVNATKYNETFLTQNFDFNLLNIHSYFFYFLWRFYSYKLWVIKINTMRYKYAFFGIPLLREVTVLNEKGLAHGGNGIQFNSNTSQPIDEGEGMSLVSLRRLTIMTCKNVTEAVTLCKNTPRESSRTDGIMTAVYCDKEGGLAVIEQTHSYFVSFYGNSTDMTDSYENILWHTNHFQWLDPNLTGSVKPEDVPDSMIRYQRCKELLEENYGNITLDVCKHICRDHGGGTNKDKKDSSDICVHPDKNSTSSTCFSYIVKPDNLTVYFTHGSPCRCSYVCRNLTEEFEKEYPFFDYLLY